MLQWPDILYVLYDVLVEGIVIIPRGSKVYGTWISDNDPRIAAQFQADKIEIMGSMYDIQMDTDVYDQYSYFNNREVNDSDIIQTRKYPGTNRRFAIFGNVKKSLLDNCKDTLYIKIDTKEIPARINNVFHIDR